jgi:hypothetical protein
VTTGCAVGSIGGDHRHPHRHDPAARINLLWNARANGSPPQSRLTLADGARRRQVRTIRDYGMQDRRENLQYHPDAPTIAHPDHGWRHLHALRAVSRAMALCMSSVRAA